MPAERIAWALTGAYLALSALRIGLTVRNWKRARQGSAITDETRLPVERVRFPTGVAGGRVSGTVPPRATEDDATGATDRAALTVMQPILSGDPNLPHLLGENIANHPGARFLWLVDSDDTDGRRITCALAAHDDRIEVQLCPPCPPLTNPKVFKLALGLPHCTEVLAVLDDDTVLPAGALDRARTALPGTDLVTGLPWYRPAAGPWARLVASFVNGNALITYFPLLGFGEPVTINGMFYLTTRSAIARAGGFEAILDRVCDDYELARQFRHAGLRLQQSTITHPITTDVPDAAAYMRLMHRWLVFSTRLLRDSPSAPLGVLVLAPTVLPPLALAVALGAGGWLAPVGIVAAVAAKVGATQVVRARLTPEVPRHLAAEFAADWLLPLQAAGAALLSRRITWRGRRLRVVDGRLR